MRSKYLATGLAIATGIFGVGCGAEKGPEQTFKVGSGGWFKVEEDIPQHFSNPSTSILRAGQTCVIDRGAELVLKDGSIFYENDNALGTECPDGAELRMTKKQAQTQDKQYRAFATERRQVTSQVAKMHGGIGPRKPAGRGWVEVVNPEPIRQRYSGVAGTPDHENLVYGDECALNGEVKPIGHLTTGQTVMRVIYPEQLGTSCPSGVLYLDPPGAR
ncbi:MAG TPA: hypothetical protein VFK11_00100 [Candidatus Saccharimonadales bacterium]|nr:hypothetical protein [Candidatus Saccharimonadales bacterium]